MTRHLTHILTLLAVFLTCAKVTPVRAQSSCTSYNKLCSSCIAASCGYCAATYACTPGSQSGPDSGSCSTWIWSTARCPYVPVPACSWYIGVCSSCTRLSSCGFCRATGSCTVGSSSGPSGGSCPSWAWLSSSCSAVPETSCVNCARTATGVAFALAGAALRVGQGGGGGGHIMAVSSLQATFGTPRIASKMRDCVSFGDVVDSPNEVGTLFSDNPTRIHFRFVDASWAAGTVIGNTLLLIVLPPVLTYAVKCAGRVALRVVGIGASKELLVNTFVGCYLFAFSALQPPTMAASTMLLLHGQACSEANFPAQCTTPFVIASVGYVAFCLPLVHIVGLLLLFAPLQGRKASRCTGNGRLQRSDCVDQLKVHLFNPNSVWQKVSSDANSCGALGDVSVQLLQTLIESCRYGYSWMIVVDVVLGAAEGILNGLVSSASSSCAETPWLSWSLLGVCFSAFALNCALRVRITLAETLLAGAQAALAVVAVGLAIQGNDDASDAIALTQCLLQFLSSIPCGWLQVCLSKLQSSVQWRLLPARNLATATVPDASATSTSLTNRLLVDSLEMAQVADPSGQSI